MHLVYRNEVKIQKILRISLHNPLESSFSEVLADSKLKISWQSFFAMRKARHIPVFINGRIVSRPREVIFTFCWSCFFFFFFKLMHIWKIGAHSASSADDHQDKWTLELMVCAPWRHMKRKRHKTETVQLEEAQEGAYGSLQWSMLWRRIQTLRSK